MTKSNKKRSAWTSITADLRHSQQESEYEILYR